MSAQEFFQKFAVKVSRVFGSPWAFAWAVAILITWVALGPVFSYSDTWQLFINTLTTIMTFLTVFLIQNTQNRDTKAIHVKLDELLKSSSGARNDRVGAEQLSDKELDDLLEEYRVMHEKYVNLIKRKASKTSQK